MKKFTMNAEGTYLQNGGVNVMAFDDDYVVGHQGGVSMIMHGNRVACCGDLRFARQGRGWNWLPEFGERTFGEDSITAACHFENKSAGKRFDYTLTAKAEGEAVRITAQWENPPPDDCTFHLFIKFYPGNLFGKPWRMDGKDGIFPRQPDTPLHAPYAVGRRLVIRPDDALNRFAIEAIGADIRLEDERMSSTGGWFTATCPVLPGENKVEWRIVPNVVDGWLYPPVVQASQVGYHTDQPKTAVIELDKNDANIQQPRLCKITEHGAEEVPTPPAKQWGQFLRYKYLQFDFTDIREAGLYKIAYGTSESELFRIAPDVYERGIWQPVLEWFLPVQMCHMKVVEKNRVWHGECHRDDAKMAPVNHEHFDGYRQGPSTLCKYQPGEHVPGLNIGGWHDAGDDDIRTETQAPECYILALAYEAFNIDLDTTTVNQQTRLTEIHKPDGKNDLLQQIEHGALGILGAYRALGRLHRGIICNNMPQYTMMGDPAFQTDNTIGNDDDRWVFTEDNPFRELTTSANLAAVARVLKGFNDELSAHALEAARELFEITRVEARESARDKAREAARVRGAKIHAAAELYLTTGEANYKDHVLNETEFITAHLWQVGWFLGRFEKAANDEIFSNALRAALPSLKETLDRQAAETPYGVPYRPAVWGAGWQIQRMGFEYYFLHRAYPDIFPPDMVYNALNFILGCHPGANNSSFASGIGVKSPLAAFGWNRQDFSYVPGGVVSGTALIRPDFPELLEWPFLWQQTEYVIGGGSTHYMFLVLAAQQLARGE